MRRHAPDRIAASLDPPEAAVLKREEGTVVWEETGRDGGRLVAKLYRKRGVAAALRSRLLRFRVEREFRRLRHLGRWGIPCTEPVAWGAGWSRRHGFHELLLMREVPRAVTLDGLLRGEGDPHDLTPLFRIVRRMHESGFCHQTLYAANVLVSESASPGEEYFLSDVPRSWAFPRSLVGSRLALWDLQDLEHTIGLAGGEAGPALLKGYGLDPRSARRRTVGLGRDPTTKRRRRLRDLAARGAWVLAWCAPWRGRARPPRRG